MIVGNGMRTHFWGDAWCMDAPLKIIFPELFDICCDQNVSVAVMAARGWHYSFRRMLDEEKQGKYNRLQKIVRGFLCQQGWIDLDGYGIRVAFSL